MPRTLDREFLDDDARVDDVELRGTLADLDAVNALLGGRRLIRVEMARLPAPPCSILDVATGSGDMAAYALDVLRERGVRATCVAVDHSPSVLTVAAERLAARDDIELVQADARMLPFADRRFDLAMMTLALHHFDTRDAVQVLRELSRVAATVIVNDLRRSALAETFAKLVFPLFTRNRLTRHDAPLSVRRAYTPEEARELAARSGWTTIEVRTHPGYRLSLVGGRT